MEESRRYLRGSGAVSLAPVVERRSRPRRATISAVIPCYNAERFLGSAIASVRQQSRAVEELIVVDDGSSDGSPHIARRLGATVLETDGNAGPSAARNAGIRAARGDVIAFLDADDYWAPSHLERVVALLDRHPHAGLAFGLERRVGLWSGELERCLPEEEPVDAFWECVRHNVVPQMGVVVRRWLLNAVGGYDESLRYAEDYDLWLRLAQLAPFVCTHEVTCFHRGHLEQASRRAARIAEGSFAVRRRLWEDAGRDLPAFQARMGAVLRQAYEGYLSAAWRQRDPALFDEALALSRYVPDADAIVRRWTVRRRLLPLYIRAGWVWDRLPSRTRAAVKRPLRRLLRLG
jgi:glycosyltransferase involved in cell wall biosynthesis